MTSVASKRLAARYTEEETQALTEHYEHLLELEGTRPQGLEWLVRRIDLDEALDRLPDKYWEVVLLVGLIGFTQHEAGRLLHVSQQSVSKRYRHGLEELHYYLEGGGE